MRTITDADMALLCYQCHEAFPGFCLVKKPFPSKRCATLGSTVYVQSNWDQLPPALQYIRLHHERVHLQQFAQMGMWRFLTRYAMPHGRFLLEREAFAAEMHAVYDVHGPATLLARRDGYVRQLTGKAYYWCASAADAEAWVDATIAGVLATQSQ